MKRNFDNSAVIVTDENRETVLTDFWICGLCNNINPRSNKHPEQKMAKFVLCECQQLHIHPSCLPNSIAKDKDGKYISLEDVKFYCFRKFFKV